MKKINLISGFLVLSSRVFARSEYCLDNAPALAGSVIIGAVLTFILVLFFSKLLPRKNKIISCLSNLFILILWAAASYFVCYLIRTYLY